MDKKNSKGIGIWIIILMVLNVFISFSMVLVVGSKIDELESYDENIGDEINYAYSYEYDFSIEVLNGFSELPKGTLNQNASLELVNRYKNTYFMILKENKTDFVEDYTYYNYKNFTIDDIYEQYGVSNLDFETITYSNGFMEKTSFILELNSIRYGMNVYILETENLYARCYTWTVYSNKDYLNNINKMAMSFKEIV